MLENRPPVSLWKERADLRRRQLAKALAWGDIDATKIAHGQTGYALNLSQHMCALCGGDFPPLGWSRMWLNSDGDPQFCHQGCFNEAHNWADLPLETA